MKWWRRLSRPAVWMGLLGGAKLISVSVFNYELFTDQQIADISNGLAAILTVVGVWVGYNDDEID